MKKAIENFIGCIIVLAIGLALLYVGNDICKETWLTVLCNVLGFVMCTSAFICAGRKNR